MELEQIELSSESNEMAKGSVYVKMQLNDVLLYTQQHFYAIRNLIEQHDDLTHIITTIGFISCNMDKSKLFKDKKETPLDLYVFADVITEIDRQQDGYDLMSSNILLQIDKFVKQYIMLH
jgi:hypothetical protein